MEKDKNKELPVSVIKMYNDRLNFVKKGHKYYQNDDIAKSVEFYSKYLNAISSYYKVDKENITPKIFDKTEQREIMLISQIYWNLAKIYDRNPKYKSEVIKYLNQFIKFSAGYRWKNANYQMISNFIKRRLTKNIKIFLDAKKELESSKNKKCYIATYIYGNNHYITKDLKKIRDTLEKFNIGKLMIRSYYHLSPKIIKYIDDKSTARLIFININKPLLLLISKLSKLIK